MPKRKCFVCACCGLDLPASNLSDESLRLANVAFMPGSRKAKVQEALYVLEPQDQVCDVCDAPIEDGIWEAPRWDFGLMYQAHFGVHVDLRNMSDGNRVALEQSF
jgi:hypothetical protein